MIKLDYGRVVHDSAAEGKVPLELTFVGDSADEDGGVPPAFLAQTQSGS